MATIASVCTEDKLIRSNYYSDTYRAEFKMGGEKKTWDVQHISIPFDPVKEIMLKERFGIDESELQAFYTAFGSNLKHSLRITDALKDKG